MITRTVLTTAAFLALVAAPVQAQDATDQEQEAMPGQMMRGGMMQCPMMQAMHGQMMQGGGMMGGMHGQMMQGSGVMGGMHGQMMQGGGMMGGGMMGMGSSMHTGPAMLLQASDALDLTPEQTERLTALRERIRQEHQEHVQAAMEAHQSAASLLEGDAPDMDAYATALNEAADHMVMAHLATTRAAVEGREILTPEQREMLDDVMSMLHGMQQGMMGGGMMHGQGGGTMQGGPGGGHGGHH